MPNCRNCISEEIWKNHYLESQRRFDKVVSVLSMWTIIAFTVAVACLVATIIVIVRFQAFISNFEYYEETEYTIEQDEGINTAVIGSENEVNVYGTEDNKD